MTFHWRELTTEQRIDAIKSVYTLGASASVIAAAIGGVSRNAIVGMYNRHGRALAQHALGGVCGRPRSKESLRYRARPQKSGRRDSAHRKLVTKVCDFDRDDELAVVHKGDAVDLRALPVTKPIKRQPVDDACYEPRNIVLLALGRDDCRWPTSGGEGGAPHLFCGHTRLAGYSWCERHYHSAFQAASSTQSTDR